MKLKKLSLARGMRRGDIGPISDDIPSIFPIVFGVLLFMSTALYASQKIDERNNYLEMRKAALGLSYVALRSGYVGDAEFDAACASQYSDYAKRRSVEFLVSLKKYCSYVTLEQGPSTAFPGGGPGNIFSPNTQYPAQGPACPPFDSSCLTSPASPVSRTGKTCPSATGSKFPKVRTPSGSLQPISQENKPPNFQTLNFPVSVQCNADGTVKGPGILNVIVWRSKR